MAGDSKKAIVAALIANGGIAIDEHAAASMRAAHLEPDTLRA